MRPGVADLLIPTSVFGTVPHGRGELVREPETSRVGNGESRGQPGAPRCARSAAWGRAPPPTTAGPQSPPASQAGHSLLEARALRRATARPTRPASIQNQLRPTGCPAALRPGGPGTGRLATATAPPSPSASRPAHPRRERCGLTTRHFAHFASANKAVGHRMVDGAGSPAPGGGEADRLCQRSAGPPGGGQGCGGVTSEAAPLVGDGLGETWESPVLMKRRTWWRGQSTPTLAMVSGMSSLNAAGGGWRAGQWSGSRRRLDHPVEGFDWTGPRRTSSP